MNENSTPQPLFIATVPPLLHRPQQRLAVGAAGRWCPSKPTAHRQHFLRRSVQWKKTSMQDYSIALSPSATFNESIIPVMTIIPLYHYTATKKNDGRRYTIIVTLQLALFLFLLFSSFNIILIWIAIRSRMLKENSDNNPTVSTPNKKHLPPNAVKQHTLTF